MKESTKIRRKISKYLKNTCPEFVDILEKHWHLENGYRIYTD